MGAVTELGAGPWGLARARELARRIEHAPTEVRKLIRVLFGEDVELRKRAADVARRITENDPHPLEPYADELAGLLAELPVEESRTRWHLGLAAPRAANTHEQSFRAARLMMTLESDKSNVVRCSAVEGLGWLAIKEPSLRGEAEAMVERYLRGETLAMRSRARAVQSMLVKRYGAE